MTERDLMVMLAVSGCVFGTIYLVWLWKETSQIRAVVKVNGRLGWRETWRHGARSGIATSVLLLALLGPQLILRGESPLWGLLGVAVMFCIQILGALIDEWRRSWRNEVI